MNSRLGTLLSLLTALVVTAGGGPVSAADPINEVLVELNKTRSVVGTHDIKSYPVIFDAFLELDEPPIPLSDVFNNMTIHPEMPDWDVVSGWAESNPEMARAILACESKTLFGLPYGRDQVASEYRNAELVADLGVGGSLRDNRFPYLDAIEVIVTFATAESYRLLEAGRIDDGLDLMMASIFLVRQCCDREFQFEQMYAISLHIEMLENLRDIFYAYRDKLSADTCADLGIRKLPFLRPDRSRLLLPEGDRVVSAALIKEVFDDRGQADREKFADTFAEIQSKDSQLTRFGAARRWRMIAEVHDSKEDSLDRLVLVYNDWWRRWRVETYDPILDIKTQFDRTNPVRYAAVIYSMQNVEKLFEVRNELIAAVNGTAMAAGLCGYTVAYKTYPSSTDKMYAQFCRKRSDRDPFDLELAPFKYRVLDADWPVNTPVGRVEVPEGEGLLYSKGLDHEDDRASAHTDNGAADDLIFWPPMKVLARRAGLIE